MSSCRQICAAAILAACVGGLVVTDVAAQGPAATRPAGAADFRAVVLGKDPGDGSVGQALPDGGYTLTAGGREAYGGTDEGSFAGLQTDAPWFTFVARIKNVSGGGPTAKFGVTVRAGRAGSDKAFNVRFDRFQGNSCVQWFLRYHVAPGDHDGGRRCFADGLEKHLANPDGLWLKVVRRYPYLQAFASTDGQAWTEIGADCSKALLVQPVWVGLMATAGGDGKTPVRVTYDSIRFSVDAAPAGADTQTTYREYQPKVKTHRLTVAKVQDEKGAACSPFLLMPKDMDPKKIRAILYSAGSKEFTVNGKSFEFTKGEGAIRRPAGLDQDEGSVDVDGLDPFYAMLEHYGLVRVGGYFGPASYRAGVARLAELTGIGDLPNIPFVVTGASFAGGMSAQAAARYPDLTIASAPVIIGMAGSDTTDPKVLAVPHLHVYGSRDTVHLKVAEETTPKLREKGALWANAPMWMVAHRQYKADAIVYPYFLEALRLRLPANADYTKPVTLNALKEEDGWAGLIETWTTNAPVAVPWKDAPKDSPTRVWLPSEQAARVWQAFVSNNPRTIIHFPQFEGTSTLGGEQPFGWHNSTLAADEPWELVASGPLGKDVKVEYFSGAQPLVVQKTHDGNPYRATMAGLPAGLHAIYAVSTVDGKKEISRPVTVFFAPRSPAAAPASRPGS